MRRRARGGERKAPMESGNDRAMLPFGAAPKVTRRKRKHVGTRLFEAGSTVEASCWCDHTTVRVPIEAVARGETASCGRKGCQPPT